MQTEFLAYFDSMAFIRAIGMSRIALIISLFVIALGPSKCSAGPIPHSSTTSQLLSREVPITTCSFTGNADLYGLVIRIGVYLQWVFWFLGKHLECRLSLRLVSNEHHFPARPLHCTGHHHSKRLSRGKRSDSSPPALFWLLIWCFDDVGPANSSTAHFGENTTAGREYIPHDLGPQFEQIKHRISKKAL